MAIPNPIYVDEQALHRPSAIRLLSYGLTTGQEGVIGQTDCAVKQTGTPGNTIQIMPGAFNILAKHLGGSYESYAGKFNVAETSAPISPTTSSGGRSDLVILRIENPFVQGSGSWPVPADPVEGPYAFLRVIEGVPSTTWDHKQLTGMGGHTWSAITLGRIDRGASTGVVNQSAIRDLRSLASLGGTRTVYIENPPTEPPPIASSFYMQARASLGATGYPQNDNQHNWWYANTQWQDWPSVAGWDVPIPTWAREMDIDCQVFGAQNVVGDVFAEFRLNVAGGSTLTSQVLAIDYVQQPARHSVPFSGTFAVPAEIRGKVVRFKTQLRSYYSFTTGAAGIPAGARMDAKAGTTTRLLIQFQRTPDPA